MAEAVELLFKFKTEGEAELRRALELTQEYVKLSQQAQASGVSLGQSLDAVFTEAEASVAPLVQAVGGLNLAVLGIGAAALFVVPKLGELYNAYDPIIQAEQKSLDILKDTRKAYERLVDSANDLLLTEVEIRRGRGAADSIRSSNLSDDIKKAQVPIDYLLGKLTKLDSKIQAGRNIALGDAANSTGGRQIIEEGDVARAQRYGVQEQYDQAVAEQNKLIQEQKTLQARMGKEVADDAKRAAEEAANALKSAQQHAKQIADARTRELDAVNKYIRSFEIANETPFNQKLLRGSDLLNENHATDAQRQRFQALVGGQFVVQLRDTIRKGYVQPDFPFDSHSISDIPLVQPGQSGVNDRYSRTFKADIQESVASLQRARDFQEQILQLTAGPGGQLAAIQKIAQLRIDSAEKEFQYTGDIAKKNAEIDNAKNQRALDTLRLQKQQLEDFENGVKGGIRALVQGGSGGLRSFAGGIGEQFLEQVGGNVAGKLYSTVNPSIGSLSDKLGLPDWLTKGTLLQSQDPIKATTGNTDALRNSTAATIDLDVTLRSLHAMYGGGSSGGGVPTGIGGLQTIYGGVSKASSVIFHNNDQGDGDVQGGDNLPLGQPGAGSDPGSSLKLSSVIGYGAAAAAGAYGIYSGVKQGGAQGALTASSAALLTAAAFDPEPISKAILAVVGITAGAIKGLLPDPKQQFAADQAKILSGNAYTAPSAINNQFDIGTGSTAFSYNQRNQVRPVIQYITNQISATDPQSFKALVQRDPSAITTTVGRAMSSGDPDLVKGVWDTIQPGANN